MAMLDLCTGEGSLNSCGLLSLVFPDSCGPNKLEESFGFSDGTEGWYTYNKKVEFRKQFTTQFDWKMAGKMVRQC